MDQPGPEARARKRPAALAAVGATVAAVIATLLIPPWLSSSAPDGPSVPRPPSPTGKPDAPGTTTWQPFRCRPTEADACVAPKEIDHGGALFYTVAGSRQAVLAGAGPSRQLRVTVPGSRRDRWVLVGAEGAGSDSRLTVVLGAAAGVVVPPGRLSLFALPGHRRVVVTVADLGQPRDGEVLRVQQYLPR